MSEKTQEITSFSSFELQEGAELLDAGRLGEKIRLLIEEIPNSTGSLEESLNDGTFVYIRYRNNEDKNVVFLEKKTGLYKEQPGKYRETFSWDDNHPEDTASHEVHIINPRSRNEPEVRRFGFEAKDLLEMNKIVEIIDYIKRQGQAEHG